MQGVAACLLLGLAPATSIGAQDSTVLLKNADFSKGLESWQEHHGSNVPDQWKLSVVEKDGNHTHVLDFRRNRSKVDGGAVRAHQKLDVDVSAYASVNVRASIKVLSHSLSGSG